MSAREMVRPLDELIREGEEIEEFKRMGIYVGGKVRVEIGVDGGYFYTDGNYASIKYPAEEVPDWIRDSVNLLMVMDHGDVIPGIGARYNDTVFYIDRQEDLDDH